MSLYKAIEHKKEFRKPWHGAARFDGSCRPHGGCPWCEGNRLNKFRQKIKHMEEDIKSYDVLLQENVD